MSSSYDNRGNGDSSPNNGKSGPHVTKATDSPSHITKHWSQSGTVQRSASPQEQQQHQAAKNQPDDDQSKEPNTDSECEADFKSPDGDEKTGKLPERTDGRDASDDEETEKTKRYNESIKKQ